MLLISKYNEIKRFCFGVEGIMGKYKKKRVRVRQRVKVIKSSKE